MKNLFALNLLQAEHIRLKPPVQIHQRLEDLYFRLSGRIRREGNPLKPEDIVTENPQTCPLGTTGIAKPCDGLVFLITTCWTFHGAYSVYHPRGIPASGGSIAEGARWTAENHRSPVLSPVGLPKTA